MSDKKEIQLEIAYVLFIDIVGYSKLSLNEQHAAVENLNQTVRASEQYQRAETGGRLLKIATGDGVALVYYASPEAPTQCAVEISRALKGQYPRLQVRMGIHSGPVSDIIDVNGRPNLAGAGLNVAQRVMDCGDAGHILLSKHVAEDLAEYELWRPLLHDLGACEVKHGMRLTVVNLYADDVGNSNLPKKFEALHRRRTRLRWAMAAAGALVLAALVGGGSRLLSWNRSADAGRGTEKSIAVLPFENLSDDKQNAYFADGVQDEILTNLAKIADLKVISRTSVMQYRDTAKRNLREIADQIGVAHVLAGSVQRIANRVRVNAQLIDARTDAHIWADHYDRDLADVFAIQSEIAQAIVDQLHAKISPSEKAAVSQAPTSDLVAHALYAQAKELQFKTPERESLLQAVHLLDEAVARDPHFLLAYCLLGRLHLSLFFGGYDHTPARRGLANVAIENAVRLQPDAGEVHLARARYFYHGFRDYDRARAELSLARRTLPNDADLYFLSATIDNRQGRGPEAIRNFERAIELDPRNVYYLLVAGGINTSLRHYSEASRLLERAVAISPDNYYARTARAEQPFYERADIRPLRRELSAILTEKPGAVENAVDIMFRCAMAERDSAAADRAVAAIPPEGMSLGGNFVFPREWFVGFAARTFNNAPLAQSSFIAARALLEKLVRDQPDYAQAWGLLGLIDAALGRKNDAVREGRHACELFPLSKDAGGGAGLITNLAVIYAWSGEKDLALEQLAISAQIQSGVSYGGLKLDPQWDALRDDPRFDRIVASLAPKDSK